MKYPSLVSETDSPSTIRSELNYDVESSEIDPFYFEEPWQGNSDVNSNADEETWQDNSDVNSNADEET
ncbi:7620_t:CDS:2, partial [Racocetra fulgida]